MRFCVDENLSPVVTSCLNKLVPGHDFRSVSALQLQGFEDIELFKQLGTLDYDALITRDARQLGNPDERDALLDARLVWIGVPPRPKATGLELFANDVAAVAAALPHILSEWPSAPTAYRLSPAVIRPPEGEPI